MIYPDDGRQWVFSGADNRKIARKLLRDSKPTLPIGLPMCTAFSTRQELNYAMRDDNAARVRKRFVASLYQEQIDVQRDFLHEHPKFLCMKNLERMPNVGIAHGDRCQSQGPNIRQAAKKPKSFMSNSQEILKVLSRRCRKRNG